MYNGIGLTTPRGSGTNGYIQGNKFFVKPKTNRVTDATRPFEAGQGTAGLSTRKPNKDILEHDRKRQIELKLVILEDKLTEQGYTDSEIAEKLVEARNALDTQQEKDEEEGEVVPTPTHQKKVSDTQTHQIAARKEKQMDTFRAALGIGLSESAATPLMNNRKNGDDKREHAFLDRGGPPDTVDVDDLKEKKVDKKKGKAVGDETDGSRHRKKKKEQKRSRHQVSDTDPDTDSSIEHSRKPTRKRKSHKGHGSESDSDDDFSSGRKKKNSSKKYERCRPHHGDESGSDSDTGKDDNSKRHVNKYKSSHRRHDSGEVGSDSDDAREKNRSEVQKKKIELVGSHKRGRDNIGIESDSDLDRTRDRKKEMVKRGRHRYDTEDEGGSDISSDERVEKSRGRGRRHDSDVSSDEKVEKSRGRGRRHDSDSSSDEKVEKGRGRGRRHDSYISSDDKVEKSRGRGRRHDSDDDEDSNSSYGRKSSKSTGSKQSGARRRSISLTDDSDSSSSDEDSDISDQKHKVIGKKSAVDKDRRGDRDDADNRRGRGSHQSSEEDKGYERRGRTLTENDRSERLWESENNRELKGKKVNDEDSYEQQESKSRSRNLGKDVERERDDPKDSKFNFESSARAYREKDDRKRDDYSRLVRSVVELDANGTQDDRYQGKSSDSHRGTSKNDWDYEDRRGGRRHNRDEEEPRERKQARHEMDHKYRSHERDVEWQHGRCRERKEEEDERENRGRPRDRQLDHSEKVRYDNARSGERRSRKDDRR